MTGRRPPPGRARRPAARYEARHVGGGRYRLRRRARWPAAGVAAAGLVGAGVLSGLAGRLAEWAGHGTRAGTLAVAALLAAALWWAWRRAA